MSPTPRKRLKHYDNGEAHFFTFSCYQRLPLLSKDRSRKWFIDALEYARTKHGFQLWAWVVMPEHVHLLIGLSLPGGVLDKNSRNRRITSILADIKRPVGQLAIQYIRANAPDYLKQLTVQNRGRRYHRFWQAGCGYDENIADERGLHSVVDYIHQNPVRRSLVNRAENWNWSSARDWAGLQDVPIRVDRTLPGLVD